MSRSKRSGRKKPRKSRRKRGQNPNLTWAMVLGVVLLVVGAVWLGRQGNTGAQIAAEYGFPPYLAQASAFVQSTYAQAVNYQSEFEYLACYCGCGPGHGHRSLHDCFIENVQDDGSISYSSHAAT